MNLFSSSFGINRPRPYTKTKDFFSKLSTFNIRVPSHYAFLRIFQGMQLKKMYMLDGIAQQTSTRITTQQTSTRITTLQTT